MTRLYEKGGHPVPEDLDDPPTTVGSHVIRLANSNYPDSLKLKIVNVIFPVGEIYYGKVIYQNLKVTSNYECGSILESAEDWEKVKKTSGNS